MFAVTFIWLIISKSPCHGPFHHRLTTACAKGQHLDSTPDPMTAVMMCELAVHIVPAHIGIGTSE